MDNELLIIFIFLFCGALSFLLSGMESGVLALSQIRIRQMSKAGNRRAGLLDNYLKQPENFLWTILIGNTISNFTVLAVTALAIHRLLPGHRWLAILLFVVAFFVFYCICELLSKMLFRMFPNRLCLFFVVPFRFLHMALSPLVFLVAWFSHSLLQLTGEKNVSNVFGNREELRFLLQESAQSLTKDERVMIDRVLELQNRTLRQITVPLADVISVDCTTKVSDVLQWARDSRRARYPVWRTDGNRRKITGIVSVKQLLYLSNLDENKTASEYLIPAVFLNEGMRLEEALRRLQRSGQRMAIVMGRDHHEIGIVTVEDILKAIFGEVTL
jgi:putative hemolysin